MADRHEGVLQERPRAVVGVGVAGRDAAQPGILGQLRQLARQTPRAARAGVLDLDVDVARPQVARQRPGRLEGLPAAAGRHQPRHQAVAGAAGQAHQPLGVGRERRPVEGGEGAAVRRRAGVAWARVIRHSGVAGGVGRQQGQVGAVAEGELGARDRADAGRPRRVGECQRAAEPVVVGEGQPSGRARPRAGHLLGRRGAVEEAEGRVGVELDVGDRPHRTHVRTWEWAQGAGVTAVPTGALVASVTEKGGTVTNTEVMRRFYDEVNAGNLGIIDELIHDDLIEHDPIAPTPDKEGVRQFFAMSLAAFPDMRIQVLRTIAEGDLVPPTASSRARTRASSWASRPPAVASACRWSTSSASAAGAAEHWGVTDTGVMMQQLGVVPPPGGAPRRVRPVDDGPYYLDDLRVGQRFTTGEYELDADDAVAFASQWDPQPFHTDAEAAPGTFFGELVASGWYTAAITMRLLVQASRSPAG